MFRLVFLALLAGLVMAYRSLWASPLDGSAWEVRVRRDALFALSRADTLAFDHGRFTSARGLSEGYLPGGYAMKGVKSGSFEAVLSRGDGSSLSWRGEILEDRMQGSLVRAGPRGSPETYTFQGRRRPR